MRCAKAGWLWCAVLLFISSELAAQERTRPLPLVDAIRTTLLSNVHVGHARQQRYAAEGRQLASAARFDAVLGTSVSSARSNEATAAGAIGSSITGYDVSVSKQLRSGIVLRPSITINRSSIEGAPLASNAADVSLTLAVPLLRDWWGSVSAAPEQSAIQQYSASTFGMHDAAALAVLETASAYWSYVAAHRRLEVQLASEARAERLVEETRVLVQAEERPASDLNHVLASLASKRVARIGAEQSMLDARRRLGLTMGVDALTALALEPPSDDFPPPQLVAAESADADSALTEHALQRRPDLGRARALRRSASILSDASIASARPTLDLDFSVGYAGLKSGNGLEPFLHPLYREIPGMNVSLQLAYRFPLANSEARGALMTQTAALEQARIQEDHLERQIVTGVRVAAETLRRNARAVGEASEAVKRYLDLVDSEKEKHRLGVSTLFDVIVAEDALISSRLTEIAMRVSYAIAIAALQYEAGTLVDISGEELVVSVDRLLAPR